MSPEKKPGGKTVMGGMKRFMQALADRYHKILEVIDEALASESLKDRIWAVELLLKRAKPEEAPEPAPKKRGKSAGKLPADLSDAELLAAVEEVLRGIDD